MKKSERLGGSGPIRIGLTALAAAALAFGVSVPAYAAEVPIGPGDIVNFENGDESSEGYNYDQWHIGSNYDPEFPLESSVVFGECSITTLAHTEAGEGRHVQVLQGFPIDGRPFAGLGAYGGDGTIAEVQALIESTSITVLEGSVTIQLPIFEYDGIGVDPAPLFTTARTALLGPGTYNLADLTLVDSAGWFGGELTIAQFLEQMQANVDDDYYYQMLGVGFTGSEGAEVQSLSFGGNTYLFGTGSCLSANPTPPTSVQTAAK